MLLLYIQLFHFYCSIIFFFSKQIDRAWRGSEDPTAKHLVILRLVVPARQIAVHRGHAR